MQCRPQYTSNRSRSDRRGPPQDDRRGTGRCGEAQSRLRPIRWGPPRPQRPEAQCKLRSLASNVSQVLNLIVVLLPGLFRAGSTPHLPARRRRSVFLGPWLPAPHLVLFSSPTSRPGALRNSRVTLRALQLEHRPTLRRLYSLRRGGRPRCKRDEGHSRHFQRDADAQEASSTLMGSLFAPELMRRIRDLDGASLPVLRTPICNVVAAVCMLFRATVVQRNALRLCRRHAFRSWLGAKGPNTDSLRRRDGTETFGGTLRLVIRFDRLHRLGLRFRLRVTAPAELSISLSL